MRQAEERETDTKSALPQLVLIGGSIVVLMCTLTAGLWPFHPPRNEVRWLNQGGGLVFGRTGTVVNSRKVNWQIGPGTFSLALSVNPLETGQSGTLLALFDPTEKTSLTLYQSQEDLLIASKDPDGLFPKVARIYVDSVFETRRPVRLALNFLPGTLEVYVNGSLVKRSQYPWFPMLATDLVLGTSPEQDSVWSGEFFSLAIYSGLIPVDQISADRYSPSPAHQMPVGNPADLRALYSFMNGHGRTVRSLVPQSPDLSIPERFQLANQAFLTPPWLEFHNDKAYWNDLLINVLGFVPLGCAVSACFSRLRRSPSAVIYAVLAGIAVTFTIEILQGYLPTRHSGMTDLFTNTAGAWAGALFGQSQLATALLTKLFGLAPAYGMVAET